MSRNRAANGSFDVGECGHPVMPDMDTVFFLNNRNGKKDEKKKAVSYLFWCPSLVLNFSYYFNVEEIQKYFHVKTRHSLIFAYNNRISHDYDRLKLYVQLNIFKFCKNPKPMNFFSLSNYMYIFSRRI